MNNTPTSYSYEDIEGSCFLQSDGSVWAYADSTAKQAFRREDRCISHQKRIKVIPTAEKQSGAASLIAVEFALNNGRLNVLPMLRNDLGELVEVPVNIFKLFHTGGRKNTHVHFTDDGKKRANPWMVRFQNKKSKRVLKAVATKADGKVLFRKMFEAEWRAELEKYSLWNTYINTMI